MWDMGAAPRAFTATTVSFTELLRAALNDPSSVQTSQVSGDMGTGKPWWWHLPRMGNL